MFRKILAFIIVISTCVAAQIQDSTSAEIKIYSDTLSVKPDSLLSSDSLLTVVEVDSIVPIYSSVLSFNSSILKNSDLLKHQYQYTGDYLRAFSFNFVKDLGFVGQPNENFIYGVGNNAVSYLLDGVSYNDRYSNSLNLNFIQSEDVDSIEMIPLTRGFLYGAYNNPVSVNFITKDIIPTQPYTRIKFYQGANRDMMFDGRFNAMIINKLIASFDITNRIFDGIYQNSDYSIWQGKFKLKYLLSNKINIIATYNYSDYKAGFSGGVSADSINSNGANLNNVLYDYLSAQMIYPNGEIKSLTHLPKLRFLIKPFENIKTDFSLFYLYNDYEKSAQYLQLTEDKVFGVNFKNDFNYDPINFQVITDYEKGKINRWERRTIDSITYQANIPTSEYDIFSVSGNFSLQLLNGSLIPSVFGKLSSYYNKWTWENSVRDFSDNPVSLGFDLTYKATEYAEIYIGYSNFQPYSNYSIKNNLSEAAIRFNFENLRASIKYFRNDHSVYNTSSLHFGRLSGFGLTLHLKYSVFLLQSNSSFYQPIENETLYHVPDFQTQIGVYYTNNLFKNNLELKTGFIFYYTGKNNVFTYENGLIEVPASNKLDFTLVGEIQKTAIVYFLWQNLLGNEYYITPYYPMPGRSIRFGVAWEMFN